MAQQGLSRNVNTQATRGQSKIYVDTIQVIITNAATKASMLSDDGYDMSAFSNRLKTAACCLEEISSTQEKRSSEQYVFPELEGLLEKYPCRNLKVTLPSPIDAASVVKSIEERKKLIEKNIELISLPDTSTFAGIVDWLNKSKVESSMASSTLILKLRTVEEFMWGLIGKNKYVLESADLDRLAELRSRELL
eukprot:283814-Ditylum_brightwellii.AAC.1